MRMRPKYLGNITDQDVHKGAKTIGIAMLAVAGVGAGVLGLIAGYIAGHPGKGALIGAFGVPILLKVAWSG